MKIILNLALLAFSTSFLGQQSDLISENIENDSVKKLPSIIIKSKTNAPENMQEIQDNIIFSGKKNEVIHISNTNANTINNNVREVLSKVAGVSIWENDGSGIQINIGFRGLSPNRSWELNTRQNGYDISSDIFGYPEAYYNPPLEAVDQIQIVRGGASLQFGSQFGGMVNYVLKRETEKKFSFETQNTVGSYGLFSSFNAIGGKLKKFQYYIYNHSRKGDGWRDNNGFDVRNSHAFFGYNFSDKTKLSFEYTNMDYKMQQPGGLTDTQFAINPKQANRNRNWFGTPWNLASINFDTQFSNNFTLNIKVFGLVGERNSVGFVKSITTADAIVPTTLNFENRQVDKDNYKNFGIETRSIFTYNLFNNKNHLAFGTRFYKANTNRRQQEKGTTASDFDLNIDDTFTRNLNFTTQNIAFFAENQFKPTKNLSITPGIRFENIESTIDGQFGITANVPVLIKPNTIKRNEILTGIGIEYQLNKTNFYTNFSQAFRPVLFSDLTPPATTDVIDPNLKDANGYNFDIGYRGKLFGFVTFDYSYFYLRYNNRIGTVRQFVNNNPALTTFQFRTNLGRTNHQGFETFTDISISKALKMKEKIGDIHFFATLSFIEAIYADFKITETSGTVPDIKITTKNLTGNRVENAPRYIHNYGISYNFKNFSATIQNRRQGMVFTDANNTITPSANGVTGKINGFNVYDFAMEYQFFEKYNIKTGLNNLEDIKYATRRAGGYPGPGLIPNEGRTFYISLGAKF